MPGTLLYLDTSALVKAVAHEAESDAVYGLLRSWPQRVSSLITWVELPRAAMRKRGGTRLVRRAEALLERIDMIELDVPLAKSAAALLPQAMRSLDAIHLATALSLGDDLGGFLAYDTRLVEAAGAAGLPTLG